MCNGKDQTITNISNVDVRKEDVMRIPLSRFIAIQAGFLFLPTYAIAAPVVFSGSGSDAASIQGTVDGFRTVLGANNAMEG